MKKILFLLSMIFGSTFCFGQTFDIDNLTSTDMYVHLWEVDGACNITSTNVFCPANTLTTVAITNAGGVIEFAFVSDYPLALADPLCYYIKVQIGSITPNCVSGYPTVDTGTACTTGSSITTDFSQTNMFGVPYLIIN